MDFNIPASRALVKALKHSVVKLQKIFFQITSRVWISNITWFSEMLTVSLKTIQSTVSVQGGEVNEPL